MKLSFNFKHILSHTTQNMGPVLYVVLAVLILLEGLVVQQSVQILLSARRVQPTPKTQLVRVNFGLYDTIAKRFGQQGLFTPAAINVINPFGVVEATSTPR